MGHLSRYVLLLIRGLFELGEYSSLGVYRSGPGITWPSLHDQGNGMGVVWVILAVEWGVFMVGGWEQWWAR
jgi:hypothetical protein